MASASVPDAKVVERGFPPAQDGSTEDGTERPSASVDLQQERWGQWASLAKGSSLELVKILVAKLTKSDDKSFSSVLICTASSGLLEASRFLVEDKRFQSCVEALAQVFRSFFSFFFLAC